MLQSEVNIKEPLPVPHSTHSVYKMKYASFCYQPTAQGLSSQTPLTRRKFELKCVTKYLHNITGMARSAVEFRATLKIVTG
jgi:hypothetical protein